MSDSPSQAGAPASQVAGTAAFSKFMHLLQLVADADTPQTVGTLSQASGYPRPTVHRTVAALLAEGLLVERAGALALGPRLLQLAGRSWERSELRQAATEVLRELRDATGETVHLAIPSGTQMVYIQKLDSPSNVRMTSRIGRSVSMHSTSVGKAYLALLEPSRRDALLARLSYTPYMPNTVGSAEALAQQLEVVRARGWSSDEEENEAGIACFGAPILGADQLPVAAVSVSTLRFRQRPDPLRSYVEPLLQACRTIAERIAHTPAAYEASF